MCNFHPLEVVNRGSEIQLQVGGNLNKKRKRKGLKTEEILVYFDGL